MRNTRYGIFSRATACALTALMLFCLPTGSTSFAADDDAVTIGLRVGNKVDVALAIGPTAVDYSTFEPDLRALLSAPRTDKAGNPLPPIPQGDLYITATQAVAANSTSAFSWWTYDHTKPGTMKAANNAAYGGVPVLSDTTHTYIETDFGSDTTSNGSTITDPSSPDNGSKRHPYQANMAHMIESSKGATMDFYGYAHDSYKDFRYLPNDQKTKKVFEFAIEEDVAYDALDGVGFFFNTNITDGSYESGTQKMSGYLLFLAYNTSGKGNAIKIYKFKDVTTKLFHHSLSGLKATSTTDYTIATYKENNKLMFTEVVSSSVYSATDKYRRIKLEVYPTYVNIYYRGSGSDAAVLRTPIAENAVAVNFGSKIGTDIALDASYITGYGFGPMASYLQHTCARPTHLALQNLTMTVDSARTLPEVVREPDWHERTLKFLVNLNESDIADFSSGSVTAELLARLTSDDIYYLGWCKGTNAIASQEFLQKYNLKGTIINIDAMGGAGKQGQENYQSQLEKIADYIYAQWLTPNSDDHILTTDKVQLSLSPESIRTGTADPEWPNGKWKIVHTTEHFDNPEGIYALSGQYTAELDPNFSLPGNYSIYYKDLYIKTVTVHRSPVALFDITLGGEKGNIPTFTDLSYDPDDLTAGLVSQAPDGTLYPKWQYLDTTAGEANPTGGIPGSLIEGHIYVIFLTVLDKWGATNTYARQISVAKANPGASDPLPLPFANFTLAPGSILKNMGSQELLITDMSYDLRGDKISYSWVLTNTATGEVITDLNRGAQGTVPAVIEIGANNVSLLPAGRYKLTLTVTSKNGSSIPTAHFFEIIEDQIAPTASSAPEAPRTFTLNTPITLSFSDQGGAGIKEQRVILTHSTDTPEKDLAGWTNPSASTSRILNIGSVGENYIHWIAVDNAGNVGTGFFGPYTLNKQGTTMALSSYPDSSLTYGTAITFTVVLDAKTNTYESGKKIYFYDDGTLLGSSALTGDTASFTTPSDEPLTAGSHEIRAVFEGDSTHDGAEALMTCAIARSDAATLSFQSIPSHVYDSEYYSIHPYVMSNVSYTLSYRGVGTTVYAASASAPKSVGSYEVTLTTTDENYTEKTATERFEIIRATPVITIETELTHYVAFDDVKLYAIFDGTFDEVPQGTVSFYLDGAAAPIAAAIPVSATEEGSGYGIKAITDVWQHVTGGLHEIKAVYTPAAESNFSSAEGILTDFNVDRINQSPLVFTEDDENDPDVITGLTKTYGDAGFTLSADNLTAEKSTAPVTYEVSSGDNVLEVDAKSGSVVIKNKGIAIVKAIREDDINYNSAAKTITIEVLPAAAHISFPAPPDKIFDGTPFVLNPADIRVTGANGEALRYSTTYDGIDGTSYDSEQTPTPVDIGRYRVTISVEDANYSQLREQREFGIIRRDFSLKLRANAGGSERASAFQNLLLTSTPEDLLPDFFPSGTVEFIVMNASNETNVLDHTQIFTAGMSLRQDTCEAVSDAWQNAQAGCYDIAAVYKPDSASVYNSGMVWLSGFTVYRLEQSGFAFADSTSKIFEDGAVSKAYGDDPFTAAAIGGQADTSPVYTISSGSDVVRYENGIVTILKSGVSLLSATKAGDRNYCAATTTLSITVSQNTAAAITLPEQVGKVYDGEAFIPTGILAEDDEGRAVDYTISYTGRDGTVYGPLAEAPRSAGSYTLTVMTSDDNYAPASSSTPFEITKRPLSVTLTVANAYAESFDSILLRAYLGNFLEAPTGTVTLSFGDDAKEAEIQEAGGQYYAEYTWEGVGGGDYTLSAIYNPDNACNYAAGTGDLIEGYRVSQIDQAPLSFANAADGAIDKRFGDAPFSIAASGGSGTGSVSYTLVSGEDVINFDADTQTVTLISAGTAVVKTAKAADSDYKQAEALLTIRVARTENTLSVSLASEIAFGAPITPSVTQNESGGLISYSYAGIGETAYDSSAVPPAAIGTYRLTIVSAQTANYKEALVTVDFAIIACGCHFESVTLQDDTLLIAYGRLQAECALKGSAVFVPCEYHENESLLTYRLAPGTVGAKLFGENGGGEALLAANTNAAGGTIEVLATATQPATGKQMTTSGFFTVKQEQRPGEGEGKSEAAEAAYNKNTGGERIVNVSSFEEMTGELTTGDVWLKIPDANGTPQQLPNGVGLYEIVNGKLILSEELLDQLPPGSHEIAIDFGSSSATLLIDIESGILTTDIEIGENMPKVSTSEAALKAIAEQDDAAVNKLADGYDVSILLKASDPDLQKTENPALFGDVDADEALVLANAGDKKVVLFVDISIYKTSGDNPTQVEIIRELPGAIRLEIELPEAYRGHEQYWIGRVHHEDADATGVYEVLAATPNKAGDALTFLSAKNSLYCILYQDTPVQPPKEANKPAAQGEKSEQAGSTPPGGSSPSESDATPKLPQNKASGTNDEPVHIGSDGEISKGSRHDSVQKESVTDPKGYWSPCDLAALLFAVLLVAILAYRYFTRRAARRDDKTERLLLAISVVSVICAVLLFVRNENLLGQVAIFNVCSRWFLLLDALSLASFIASLVRGRVKVR